jgi:PAS domain S-box-containing protein
MSDQTSPVPSARATAARAALVVAALGSLWALLSAVARDLLPADIYGPVHGLGELAFLVALCLGIFSTIYRNRARADRVTHELRQSETRYRAIAEMVTDFAYGIKVNADGSAVMDWANEALSKITGYDQADLLGRGTLRHLIHPDDLALFDARAAQMRRGEPYSGEFRIRTRAGDIRWIHDQAQPVWNADHTCPEYIYGASQDITARRQAEEALHASEEQLRRVTDNMLDMVSQTDAAGVFQFVSPSHQTVLGYPPDQLVGRSMFELVHPDDLNMARTAYQTGLTNRTSGRTKLRYRHADGHYVWIEIVGNLLLADDGTLLGATFGSRDITARRQYDEARARHARDLAALYDTALAINAQPDMQTLLATIVERALSFSGASMGGIYLVQADGQTLELVANIPETLTHTPLQSGEGLAGRVVQTGTMLMVPDYSNWEGRAAPFQSIKWGRVLAVPLKVRGKIIGVLDVEDAEPGVFEESTVRVISLLADQAALAIDNRQLYDQTRRDLIERRRIEEQLRESETRYRELIENVGEGITLADEDETVIFANPAAHDTLGVGPGQLVGRNWRDFTDATAFEQLRQQTALRRAGQISTYELPVIRADGQRRTLLVTARPRFDRDERYVGSFAVFRDLTERTQAAAALAAARNDLARRNEQLTQILEASNTIRSQLSLDQVLHEIAAAAYRSLGFHMIAVNLIDATADRVRVYTIVGDDEAGRKLLEGVEYQWAMVRRLLQERFRRGRCYFVPQGEFNWERDFSGPYHDAVQSPLAVAADEEAWQPEDALIVPIELRDGEIVGLLWPDGPVDGLRPSADTLRLLEIFAAQAAIALENARLFEAERLRSEAFEALYHASRQLTRSLDLNTVLDEILSEVIKLVPAANAHIFLYDGARLHFGAARRPDGSMQSAHSEPRPGGLTYTTAHSGETIFIEDSATHPLYAQTDEMWRPFAIASLPLKNEGTIVGVMNVAFGKPRRFVDAERAVLVLFAAQAAIAIQNARLHQEVQQHAHQLEQRVTDRTAELDRQRQWLQAVLDAAGEGIQIMDSTGRMEYINPATERLTGYSAEEVLGHTTRFLFDDSVATTPAARDLQRAFQRGDAWRGELVNRRRDGTLYDVALTLTPLADPDGTLSGFVAVHRDITRFRELDRLKDQFVSRIGHELRTPVANIKLYLELLERGQPERYPQYVQTLQRETDRLRRLIDGFLEMAQLDAGAVLIRPTAVNLNQLVLDLLVDRRPVATDRGLTLDARTEAALPPVQTDRTLIAQAISNLVDNALNYTPPGGQVVLTTGQYVADDTRWVTVGVADTGPGITPDERSRLHERFYRGEAARDFKVPGAGLGLSIVDAIMAQLGGRLTVDSQPGQGATFTVWLPGESASQRISE